MLYNITKFILTVRLVGDWQILDIVSSKMSLNKLQMQFPKGHRKHKCKVNNCFIESYLICNNNNQLSFLIRNRLDIISSSLSFSSKHGSDRRNESNTFRSGHLTFYSISYKTLFLYYKTILTENFYYGLCKILPLNILNLFLKVES